MAHAWWVQEERSAMRCCAPSAAPNPSAHFSASAINRLHVVETEGEKKTVKRWRTVAALSARVSRAELCP